VLDKRSLIIIDALKGYHSNIKVDTLNHEDSHAQHSFEVSIEFEITIDDCDTMRFGIEYDGDDGGCCMEFKYNCNRISGESISEKDLIELMATKSKCAESDKTKKYFPSKWALDKKVSFVKDAFSKALPEYEGHFF
jgi:hypothetical protein